jgi:hypothetical protein
MKIDRVILTLNNNKTYTPFWNIVAPIWKNIFNITPTLIFNGTQEEFDSNNFDLSFGDYIILNSIPEVSEPNPDWSVTWSLFWGASQYPDDVCLLSGIDQIPIGNFFFKEILKYDNDKFIIGFSDAYANYNIHTLGYFNTQTNVLYPSSHLVGKGKKFKEIYQILDDWEKEIVKVFNTKDRYYLKNNFYPNRLWGIDECYSSEMISIFDKQDDIIHLGIFWDYWHKNRIDLSGKINDNFDINLVQSGYYSELTCKGIEKYKNEIEMIINNLNKLKL